MSMQGYNYLNHEVKPLRCATSQGHGNLALEAQDRMSEDTSFQGQNQAPYYVYLIEQADEQYTKIGITNDPETRLSALQTGNPQQLTLRYLLRCQDFGEAQRLEQVMHFIFAQQVTIGEWFSGSALSIISQWERVASAVLALGGIRNEEVSLTASMRNRLATIVPQRTQQDVIDFLKSNPEARDWRGTLLAEITGASEATVSRARAAFSSNGYSHHEQED